MEGLVPGHQTGLSFRRDGFRSIVAMMSHLNSQELHTYSGGYRDSHDQGELSRAKIVADHFQTHHHELAFSHQDYLEALPRFIAYMDDPVADAASPIRMLLAGVAKEEVPFILGGEGGDDVTGGYGLDQIQKRADRLRRFQACPNGFGAPFPP
jgi:asparagine synthetase B (glutamine-hydrolysing)